MFGAVLSKLVEQGTLRVIWPDGREATYGSGAPRVAIRLHGRMTPWILGLNPEREVGEAYMDGRLTIEEGDIGDFLEIAVVNMAVRRSPPVMRVARFLRRLMRPLRQFNPASRARRNVAHHYDLSGALYDLFLDADRQYSCAYFTAPKESLEAAQAAKKRHIAAKLHLTHAGLKVLDIG